MRRMIGIIVLVFFWFNCMYTARHYLAYQRAELIVVSQRVGETIDPQERKLFNLFQGIDDFKTAHFYSIEDGGYEVEIITESEKLRAANMDPKAVEIMRDYIDRYEEIRNAREAFEKKWKIVDYDTLGQPITRDEIEYANQHAYERGCAASACLVSLIPNALLSLVVVGGLEMGLFTETEFPRPAAALLSFIGINVLAVAAGIVVGKKLDRHNITESIKEARRPYIVE